MFQSRKQPAKKLIAKTKLKKSTKMQPALFKQKKIYPPNPYQFG